MHLQAGLRGRLHNCLSTGPSTNAAPQVEMCRKNASLCAPRGPDHEFAVLFFKISPQLRSEPGFFLSRRIKLEPHRPAEPRPSN